MSSAVSLSMSSAPIDLKSLLIQDITWIASSSWQALKAVRETWWHHGYRRSRRCISKAAYSWSRSSPGCKSYPSYISTNWEDAVSTLVTGHSPEQSQQTTWHPAKMFREPKSSQQLANDNKMFLKYFSRFLMHKSLTYLILDWDGSWARIQLLLNRAQITYAAQEKTNKFGARSPTDIKRQNIFSCSTASCCHFKSAAWPWLPVEPWGRVVRQIQ